jgi:hypothetical protein
MKSPRRIVTVAIACVLAGSVPAGATSVGLSPSLPSFVTGDIVNVAAVISGLPTGSPPSVGAFDLSVAFDPAALFPLDVTFGPYLGDPLLFEALTDVDLSSPGIVNFAEVSLLSPAELDALQPGDFTLATLSFRALRTGRTSLSYLAIRVDDAFGDKILVTAVPEPATLGLVLLGLSAAGTRLRRRVRHRRWLAGLVIAVATLLASSTAWADKVTSKAFVKAPAPGVTGKCSLEIKEADQSLTFTCDFTNTTKAPIRFVFCAMVGLNSDKINEVLPDPVNREFKPVAGAMAFVLEKKDVLNVKKIVCEKVQGGGGATDLTSVYFGCVEVTLPVGATNQPTTIGSVKNYKLITRKFNDGDEKEVPFKSFKARDFSVVYTDSINLTGMPDTSLDKDSCKDAPGQDNFIQYGQSIAKNVQSQWSLPFGGNKNGWATLQPIRPAEGTIVCDANRDNVVDVGDVQAILAARNRVALPGDPRDADKDGLITVNDARICTLRLTRQNVSYAQSPCVPTGFPAASPPLPACPVRSGPPPPTAVDLNLFTWYTEIQPAGEQIPTVLAVTATGDLTGIRVETNPPEGLVFDMIGGTDLRGRLRVCSSANTTTCLAPEGPEGSQVEVTVDITPLDPDDPDVVEGGQFIQDNQPPRVDSHTATFDASNNLVVDLVATDDTTSPIDAELWFSIDGGVTWSHLPLDSTTDILEDVRRPTREFVGQVGPFASGQPVRYFVAVSDEVSNVNYFGIGEVTP